MKHPWSIDEVQNIWQLASKLHDGQKYGGPNDGEKIEYINHIGSVAFEILNAIQHSEDMDADLAIKCAILHDTIEDTPLPARRSMYQLYLPFLSPDISCLSFLLF